MNKFAFKAVSRAGQIESGVIEAVSTVAAQQVLKKRGLTPLSLKVDGGRSRAEPTDNVQNGKGASKQQGSAGGLSSVVNPAATAKSRQGAIKADDVLRFTSELAVLLRAGLPLDRAIKVQIDSAAEGPKRELLLDLLNSLKGGKALSVGLEKRPDIFNNFYINMVRSGEASGNLAGVLQDLGAYLTRAKAVRSTVISALIYPAILSVVAILSVGVMLGFVVPEFEALFEDMGEALPVLTRVVIGLGDFVAQWGWLAALSLMGLAVLIKRWLAKPEGKHWLDQRIIKLPLAGTVALKFEVARFSRTLGTLLGNGVALLKATDIATGTVGNFIVREALCDLAPTIKRGGRMSEALKPEIFSPVAVQMIRVGEESGSLDGMLLELAQVYESDVEAEVKRGLTLLEPALILGMGGVIALIIMAVLMGILSVNNLAV